MRSHEWIDERSLALHQAVAAKLEAQPELLVVAHQNLQRWLSTGRSAAWEDWERLLKSLSMPELLALLRARDERATRLRQSSPFAGVLPAAERLAIFARYEPGRA